MDGLLVVNKPAGVTSRTVVDRVAQWFPGVRIGHAGTLDPLATGVLVLCVGQATRLIEYVQRMAKTYRAELRLGSTSDTDDADGTVIPAENPPHPTPEQLGEVLSEFLGEIAQVPPAHSAVKVAGRRAYALARKGHALDLAPRPIRIDRIDVLNYGFPDLVLEIDCGKGTYIRALARDLGRRLGCGAYVTALMRTRIGPFPITEAFGPDLVEGPAPPGLLPMRAAIADLPAAQLPDESIERLRHGQAVPAGSEHATSAGNYGEIAILDALGNLASIARVRSEDRMLVPVKNF